jgi:hypothetical protein
MQRLSLAGCGALRVLRLDACAALRVLDATFCSALDDLGAPPAARTLPRSHAHVAVRLGASGSAACAWVLAAPPGC